MKDTFIKYKDKLYPFHQCQVFSDCIRYVDWDLHDEKKEIIMNSGEWEYVELDRISMSMTMVEYDDYLYQHEQAKARQARERKERFEQEYPNWRDFPDNTIRHKYYEDNPI